jgi:hypothetical protein
MTALHPLSLAAIAIAVCVCVLTLNTISPTTFQPHRWTKLECAEYEGRATGNNDWIWAGKLTEICAKLGHP